MNDTIVLEIKPENATPKGFLKYVYYFMIVVGLFSFIFGGFILVILGFWALFIFPKNVKKNYPVSYTLTPNEFTAHLAGGWSMPWSDIESIYIISQHWAMPKSLGLRLKNYSNFQESIERNKSNKLKFFSNKHLLRLSRITTKCEIVIAYQFIDRSAEDFAQLLYLYMQSSDD